MKVQFVAEIVINHNGKLNNVFDMIDAFNFLDVIKMQKTVPRLNLSKEKYNNPHPVPKNSFGKTYGEHKEFLELSSKYPKEVCKNCVKKYKEIFKK